MAQFAQGFGFDLADAFAGDVVLFADFFQRARIAIDQAEAQFEDLAFALGQAIEDIAQLILQQAEAGDVATGFPPICLR